VEESLEEPQVAAPVVKNLAQERSLNLRDHFPFPEIRPSQNVAMTMLEKWNTSPKKFFIYEGPTGSGKSGIDIAEASYAKTLPGFNTFQQAAYILTPQKSLAEQYMTDFSDMGLVELKGRANYHCGKWSSICQDNIDCKIGASMNESSAIENDRCADCPYRAAKERFIANPLGTTNFSYYLNETAYAGELPKRNLLILDEGHNTEDQILSLTDTKITRKDCEKYELDTLPVFESGDSEAVIVWLDNKFIPAITGYMTKLSKQYVKSSDSERAKLLKRIHGVENTIMRINLFRNAAEPEEWFVWSDWKVDEHGRTSGTGDLMIKPLTARLFADDMLFSKAQKILITSATILDFDTFMRNLGIHSSQAVTLAVPSEFEPKNRPIFYSPVGNMSFKTIEKTLPLMGPAVEQLLSRYAKHKGIVHTHSYKINKFLTSFLQATGHASRIVTHDNSRGSREAAIAEHHARVGEPTVLFSPSMSEGLDLYDDLSRFQIITKVPYPALDPYVRARMQRDPAWYQWQTALKLVQATGRSIRSKTDKAHTHILDAEFANFMMKANRRMPDYWTNSIIW
jgi:ATP-dependent DNA helicase DinG